MVDMAEMNDNSGPLDPSEVSCTPTIGPQDKYRSIGGDFYCPVFQCPNERAYLSENVITDILETIATRGHNEYKPSDKLITVLPKEELLDIFKGQLDRKYNWFRLHLPPQIENKAQVMATEELIDNLIRNDFIAPVTMEQVSYFGTKLIPSFAVWSPRVGVTKPDIALVLSDKTFPSVADATDYFIRNYGELITLEDSSDLSEELEHKFIRLMKFGAMRVYNNYTRSFGNLQEFPRVHSWALYRDYVQNFLYRDLADVPVWFPAMWKRSIQELTYAYAFCKQIDDDKNPAEQIAAESEFFMTFAVVSSKLKSAGIDVING